MAHPPIHEEPWCSIIEHMNDLQTRLYERTGRTCITRLCIASEFGLRLGILPGTTVYLHTACGPVGLYCEDGKKP